MKSIGDNPHRTRTLWPILILVTGILLLIMKVIADSEPGAIPLLLIVSGGGWYWAGKIKGRSRSEAK